MIVSERRGMGNQTWAVPRGKGTETSILPLQGPTHTTQGSQVAEGVKGEVSNEVLS
ncbi:hypothetical protein DPMN_187755 [Dreissena polymorpha]|uniref:Uncharacterized protein n=1 Tax=Dreissena polymorpha TaxID=45954 RepID=A0A9D4DSP3_DREPO|nr:hypothetical protein DPMN_187755 [Dreissena polymorpha]